MNYQVPAGMTRRHFAKHLIGASALAGPALTLGKSLSAAAPQLTRTRKSAILLWMGGGPSTMDIWDLKPDASTGGLFRPIKTTGDMQICQHMPLMAQHMDKMSVVRNMSTSEADHDRGRYYMHTGYVPNPNMEHPGYGSVIANQLMPGRDGLQLPPFVSVGGASEGPGFLGMAWAPFTVDANGNVRNLQMNLPPDRLSQRMQALKLLESGFIDQKRGPSATEHAKVLQKTLELMTSQQMEAFRVRNESPETLEQYGDNNFGRGCLMARRLVEAGVPFVEVNFGGWDNHQDIFATLENDRLPTLDKAMSKLTEDLVQRGLFQNTAVIWMGEFGRTPRINGNAGRDHWARSWSVVVGGGGIEGGKAIGSTNEDGTRVEGSSNSSEDLMATVCKTMGISLATTFTSNDGRPMKIANSGRVIEGLL